MKELKQELKQRVELESAAAMNNGGRAVTAFVRLIAVGVAYVLIHAMVVLEFVDDQCAAEKA